MAANMALILIILCAGKLKVRTSNKLVLNLMTANFCIGLVMFCFGCTVVALNSTQHTFADHADPPISIRFDELSSFLPKLFENSKFKWECDE